MCIKFHGVAKMAKGTTSKMHQKNNCTILDEFGKFYFFVNRKFVEGVTVNIMSLTRLIAGF